jgi:hypothetical protein
MSSQVRTILFSLVWTLPLLACGPGLSGASGGSTLGTSSQALSDPGALIKEEMDGTVGVLLDEIPAGCERDAAAAHLLAQGNDFWTDRAGTQIFLTNYRLVFRTFYYTTTPAKGALPLAPESVRTFALTGAPQRTTIGGHDYVAVNYHYLSYIVTDPASPGASEPALASVGGTWDEPFILPADPELVFQRTGYTCMDESGTPPNSVFGDNIRYYYDQTCAVETPATAICHVTEFPHETCVDALNDRVGKVSRNMHFTRVAYDEEVAEQFRVGAFVNPTGADLAGYTPGLTQEHTVIYKYIPQGDCPVGEGTAGPPPIPGWRRFLIFTAAVDNDGTLPIDLGDQTGASGPDPYVIANDLEPSTCDSYLHFHGYANFAYNGSTGVKDAYCINDSDRYLNLETASLSANYLGCTHQGIDPAWGDEYQWGLPFQWVDITNVDSSQPHDLTFNVNPEHFFCEGQTLGANNQPVDPTNMSSLVFDPTTDRDPEGNVIGRVRCDLPGNWHSNDVVSASIAESGTFINQTCTRGQIGPKRDCGWRPEGQRSCTPGSTVTLQCHSGGSQQVLRVCERSEALGVGVDCQYADRIANHIIDGDVETVSFTCPAVRDSTSGAGGYSLYQAPLLPWDSEDEIDCD